MQTLDLRFFFHARLDDGLAYCHCDHIHFHPAVYIIQSCIDIYLPAFGVKSWVSVMVFDGQSLPIAGENVAVLLSETSPVA